MDTEELTMDEKCENLMNVVVESRKRFGKRCADYERKTAVMENQILNLQISTIASCKNKNPLPRVEVDEICKDIDEFAAEIIERKQRIENLMKKVKDTQQIVLQLQKGGPDRLVHYPLTAEAMLAHAKQKQMQQT